ncbi:DUF6318 family protein [Nesterenkonia sphaerica]|uniref:DUF6318 domain-containing protein n=1 Tax=Nesterenkonia sphaerica TaxID=1804988 RepID=A0A5R9A925_9MICC|nr:DUF6318 family protein [Nesterenkonia sphaerica]TLP74296.1 hypothetical protein FEF27_09055 [Nesterenkonia sphaerica]
MTHFKVLGTAAAAALMAVSTACAEGTDRAEAEEMGPTAEESADDSSDDAGLESSEGDAEEEQVHDEPEESEEPEPIPASSEGPAQNWPAPEPPEEIYEPTEEGAEALLQYWFDARHYARITGDTQPLEDVSHEDCEMCRLEGELVQEVFANNGWYTGDGDAVTSVYVRVETPGNATGMFILEESEFDAHWQGKSYGKMKNVENNTYIFNANLIDDGWKVSHVGSLWSHETSQSDARGLAQ